MPMTPGLTESEEKWGATYLDFTPVPCREEKKRLQQEDKTIIEVQVGRLSVGLSSTAQGLSLRTQRINESR